MASRVAETAVSASFLEISAAAATAAISSALFMSISSCKIIKIPFIFYRVSAMKILVFFGLLPKSDFFRFRISVQRAVGGIRHPAEPTLVFVAGPVQSVLRVHTGHLGDLAENEQSVAQLLPDAVRRSTRLFRPPPACRSSAVSSSSLSSAPAAESQLNPAFTERETIFSAATAPAAYGGRLPQRPPGR